MTTRYVMPMVDLVFKHLMTYDDIRNHFIGSLIGQQIRSSTLLDHALNPLPAFYELHKFINAQETQNFLTSMDAKIKEDRLDALTKDSNLKNFLEQLSMRYHDLLAVIPSPERATQLDMICQTDRELIEVEVQVEPQNFWDIRILSHVCGLFSRQFSKGFKWEDLSSGSYKGPIRKVIGISLFAKAPRRFQDVQENVPWYEVIPWGDDELKRSFSLREDHQNSKKRPGIEFIDFNLEAFERLLIQNKLGECPNELKEWLSFFAFGNTIQNSKLKINPTIKEVKDAYSIISHLPQQVMSQYEKLEVNNANISHYVSGVAKESREQGIAEGMEKTKVDMAKIMKKAGEPMEKIILYTQLSQDEIEKL